MLAQATWYSRSYASVESVEMSLFWSKFRWVSSVFNFNNDCVSLSCCSLRLLSMFECSPELFQHRWTGWIQPIATTAGQIHIGNSKVKSRQCFAQKAACSYFCGLSSQVCAPFCKTTSNYNIERVRTLSAHNFTWGTTISKTRGSLDPFFGLKSKANCLGLKWSRISW